MRSPGRYLALAAVAMATGPTFAQEPAYPLPAITITPTANGIEIVGSAVGIAPSKVTGTIMIERQGRSGTVKTSQSRELDLAAGETAYIARTGVSFGTGDALNVVVTLERNGRVIATATVRSGD